MAEKSKHWWETLGGLLTGIAALITACTGLMVALYALAGERVQQFNGHYAADRDIEFL